MAIVRPGSLPVETHAAAGRDVKPAVAPDCPVCGILMIFWSGYWRFVRVGFDPDVVTKRRLRIWVPRVRCKHCRNAPGLLPAFCLSRRLDEVDVIGVALVWVVAGRPVGAVAALLAIPRSTARGWVVAFVGRAVAITAVFASLAIAQGSDAFDLAITPAVAAVEAIGRAYDAVRRRLAGNVVGLWRFVSVVSGGAVIATNKDPPFVPVVCSRPCSTKGGRMDKPRNRAEDIALFRFSVIAPAANSRLSPAEPGLAVRDLAGSVHLDSEGMQRVFSRSTLDRWIRSYWEQGLQGLMPTPRADTGALRRHPELFEEAAALRRELPARSSDAIADMLYRRHGIQVSPRTIRSQLATRGLTRQCLLAEPSVLGRYEAPRPNARWIGDFLIGPWVPYPRVPRSRRAKLILFVDDHSRLLVHGVWSFMETTRIAQLTLKAAILRRGLPDSLYRDRGSAFITAHLRRSAGVLGIQIIHSRPYRPPLTG